MKIVYSPRAVSDLTAIADYLTERSLQGALAVERRIREVIGRLAEFPGMGRELTQRPGVRVMPLGRYPYLIFIPFSKMSFSFCMSGMHREGPLSTKNRSSVSPNGEPTYIR